jgi:hypothetical protein
MAALSCCLLSNSMKMIRCFNPLARSFHPSSCSFFPSQKFNNRQPFSRKKNYFFLFSSIGYFNPKKNRGGQTERSRRSLICKRASILELERYCSGPFHFGRTESSGIRTGVMFYANTGNIHRNQCHLSAVLSAKECYRPNVLNIHALNHVTIVMQISSNNFIHSIFFN